MNFNKSSVLVFSPLGIYLRFKLADLINYADNYPAEIVTYAIINVIGSSLLGFSNVMLLEFSDIKIVNYIFSGFGIGLCGCLTSFSSWSTLIAEAIAYDVY